MALPGLEDLPIERPRLLGASRPADLGSAGEERRGLGDDLAQQAPVAVAEFVEELPVVRRIRLVAEVLDRVVFLVLAVKRRPADLVRQLALLLEQALLEVRQSIFSHRDLPRDSGGAYL